MARKRRSARALLFDPQGRVLLIRFVVPRQAGEFVFWVTPGGEIEPGETESAAAARELHEELGLAVPVDGPIHVETNQFVHEGELRENTDYFFRATCAADAPRLLGVTEAERSLMQEWRWFTRNEVEQLSAGKEAVFPVDLAAWLGAINTRP